ncbi:hypothetical protein [Nostoc sp.]
MPTPQELIEYFFIWKSLNRAVLGYVRCDSSLERLRDRQLLRISHEKI